MKCEVGKREEAALKRKVTDFLFSSSLSLVVVPMEFRTETLKGADLTSL